MRDATSPSMATEALLTRWTTARIVYSDALDALLFESAVLVLLFSEEAADDDDDEEDEEEEEEDDESLMPFRA